MKVRKAGTAELDALAVLAQKLWPGHTLPETHRELEESLLCDHTALFLAMEGESPLGFAQCQLRRDYVEGTSSSPVGYLEGIFVEEACRRQGIARELLSACREWARNRGCREFASDCELHNEESLRFHLALGFQEAGRIICFTHKL